jgi:cell division protein FtsQ
VVLLLFLANRRQQRATMLPPDVYITVDGGDAFLTKEDLILRLKRQQLIFPEQTFEEINGAAIENSIRKMEEVLSVDVYKKLGNEWKIDITTRRPLARIFNNRGEDYYLDATGHTIKPSILYTARVVVVNGNIPDRKDSLTVNDIINNPALKSKRILDDVYRISNYVCNHPLFRAQIGQIFRQTNGDFVLIPQVGAQRIIFGTAKTDAEVQEKFSKLEIFYKQAMPYEGWTKYDQINLKYSKQIVCRKKEEIKKVESNTETAAIVERPE